ncbi:MAG TPA: hypothetical protein VNH21_04825 [Steroidobacteraceae bacterium]|nr:hypothetical protein [Steroidobacteraceae bacterium]
MADPLAVALKIDRIAGDLIDTALRRMEAEGWKPEFQAIMLRAIANKAARCAELADATERA